MTGTRDGKGGGGESFNSWRHEVCRVPYLIRDGIEGREGGV